ncbi:unnamed protein product [Ixodes persulcatus]
MSLPGKSSSAPAQGSRAGPESRARARRRVPAAGTPCPQGPPPATTASPRPGQ